MKNYQWVLFDADDTLFHFDAFRGLQHMFSVYGVEFTLEDYQEYQALNAPLWINYQNGSITAKQLQYQRFNTWAEKLNCCPHSLNSAFLASMAEICAPLEGATNLLSALKNKSKLGIITNGFTELQEARLNRTGHREFFDILVISEQVGIAKPHRDIFEHALSLMGNPNRQEVLMVGDNPDSDILGGMNAGLDTCWLNINNKPIPEAITPTYHVSSLKELQNLLLGDYDA